MSILNIKDINKRLYNPEVSSLFSVGDILDWNEILKSLKGKTTPDKKRIWEFFDEKTKRIIEKWTQWKALDENSKNLIIKELNKILGKRDFYDENTFKDVALDKGAKELYREGLKNLNRNKIKRFNRFLFESIYPQQIAKIHSKIEAERLTVTPILNPKVQIEGPGIDLRLSNQFIVFNPEHISHFNIGKLDSMEVRKYQNHVVVPFHNPFILHPKTIVLGSTLEYISMPTNLEGTLEGRSSWARLGLIVATACAIDPGFKGCVTLELTNLGNIPLSLYPGIRLAKLILSDTSSPSVYPEEKKYFCQIGPEFSKVYSDKELKIFTRKDNSKR